MPGAAARARAAGAANARRSISEQQQAAGALPDHHRRASAEMRYAAGPATPEGKCGVSLLDELEQVRADEARRSQEELDDGAVGYSVEGPPPPPKTLPPLKESPSRSSMGARSRVTPEPLIANEGIPMDGITSGARRASGACALSGTAPYRRASGTYNDDANGGSPSLGRTSTSSMLAHINNGLPSLVERREWGVACHGRRQVSKQILA